MPACETPSGALRIGLAHGGVRGFGSEGDGTREIIPPNRAQSANLDYLALGDWHAMAKISPTTFYPGTPEPDRHKIGDRGQVLSVTLSSDQAPQIDVVPTASFDWPLISVVLEPETVEAALAALQTQLREGHPLRQTHVRLDISGEMTAAEWTIFDRFVNEMTGECASFDLRGASDVRLVVVAEDIESLDAQGSVREAAEVLTARSTNPDLSRDDRQIASGDLRLLFRYAGETV